MKSKLDELYLEGTSNLLGKISNDDKEILIKYVSNQDIRDPQDSKININSELLSKVTCDKVKVGDYITAIIDFYASSIPENFKKIKDGNDLINKNGDIFSFCRKRIKTSIDSNGYSTVNASMHSGMKLTRVDILVATTFIGYKNDDSKLLHIDNDKLNNHVDNLRWVNPDTSKEPISSNTNKTEGAVLTNLWRTTLQDLNLTSRVPMLIDTYINRHNVSKDQSLSLKKKNKTSITGDVTSDAITWKTFLNLMFNVLRVKKIDITITLHHENSDTSVHKTSIKK